MDIDIVAKIVWNYLQMHHELKKSDAILVLGSHDIRVAIYATDLFLQGYAPRIIFSGGVGRLTADNFHKAEAEVFADIAIEKGVPKDKILIENKSTNTGENIQLTKQLLATKGLEFNSFIIVQKPYMERRAYATFKKLWPEKQCVVTSPPLSYEEYPNDFISKEEMINIMVGDLQRINLYEKKGFQIQQEIPIEVQEAYEYLLSQGFTQYVLSE
jgi:uncharacterized SAM-binding protein YcdF (DUF218 family)